MNEELLRKQMIAVKQLGDEIGYGNLMWWASALWRRKLSDLGYPHNGAFVPRLDEIKAEDKVYDSWVEKFIN